MTPRPKTSLPRHRGRTIAILVGAACALPAAPPATARTPLTLPGWPVTSATGSVHDGSVGGLVVLSDGVAGRDNVIRSIAAGFRPTGRRDWVSTKPWGCGNCDDGLNEPALLPDGTYGPVGPEGDGAWGVTPLGAITTTCIGLMLVDTTCIAHQTTFAAGSPPVGRLTATRNGGTVWDRPRPTFSWVWASGLEAPPLIMADRRGVAYTGLGSGTEAPSTAVPKRVLAFDTLTGATRWTVDDAEPVAALDAGVVASHDTFGLARYAADGSRMWNRADLTFAPGRFIVRVDLDRDRIYYSPRGRLGRTHYVAAIDAATGADLWRTPLGERATVLDIRKNGTVLAAIDRPGRTGLRAIGADGLTRWQFDTATPVAGAHALGDGTVALTTSGAVPSFADTYGLAWRIDPRRAAPSTPRTSITLSRTRFSGRCTASCQFSSTAGTVLRLQVPARTAFRVRLLTRDGREVPSSRTTIVAPAGRSAARVYAIASAGRRIVEVRGIVRGRLVTERVPVTIG